MKRTIFFLLALLLAANGWAQALNGSSVVGASVSGAGGVSSIIAGPGISVSGPTGNVTVSATGVGSGDVIGPASANDNAITRYDGTTGKLIQSSSAYVSDLGYLGIGTATPNFPLDVVGVGSVGGNLTGGASASGVTIGFNSAGPTNDNGTYIYRTNGAGSGLFSAAGHLVFYPRTSAATFRGISFFVNDDATGTSVTETFRVEGANTGAGVGGYVRVLGTSPSTSTTTGAFIILGGVGIGGSGYFGGLVSSTTVELGANTDTTLSRVSAGRIAVEGVNVPTISSTDTFTNKTVATASVRDNSTGLASTAYADRAALVGNAPVNLGSLTGTINIDWSQGQMFYGTLTGNTTFTFSNATSGQTITIDVAQTGTNAYTVTWPSMKWSGGAAPTMTTGVATSDVTTIINLVGVYKGNSVQDVR